jgi:hypothetical protein
MIPEKMVKASKAYLAAKRDVEVAEAECAYQEALGEMAVLVGWDAVGTTTAVLLETLKRAEVLLQRKNDAAKAMAEATGMGVEYMPSLNAIDEKLRAERERTKETEQYLREQGLLT